MFGGMDGVYNEGPDLLRAAMWRAPMMVYPWWVTASLGAVGRAVV